MSALAGLTYAVPDAAVRRSVIARIVRDEGVAPELAERWFVEMLKFLDTCGALALEQDPRGVVPSKQVDAAWHAFILHTRPYTEFCERHFGGYLHHDVTPPAEDGDGGPAGNGIPQALFAYLLTRVLVAQRHDGLDEEVWPLPWIDPHNADPLGEERKPR